MTQVCWKSQKDEISILDYDEFSMIKLNSKFQTNKKVYLFFTYRNEILTQWKQLM